MSEGVITAGLLLSLQTEKNPPTFPEEIAGNYVEQMHIY